MTEKGLRRSKILLNQLFDSVPIGIALLDDQRREVQINKGFENIFGYDNDEVFGEKLNDLIIPTKSRGESINLNKLNSRRKSCQGSRNYQENQKW